MFYRGSSIDVETVIPPESLKRGDGVIIAENRNDPFDRDQFERIVRDIKASDEFDTFSYASVGIDTNPDNVRPLTWKKQTFDRIINGSIISKSRPGLSGRIVPNARVINDVKLGDTEIYVDNAFPIFSELDTISEDDRHIYIVEDRATQVAIATAVVSSASTISSFVINNVVRIWLILTVLLLTFLPLQLNQKIQSMIGRQLLELVLPLLRLTPLKRVMYRLQLVVDLDMHLVLVLTFGLIILLDLVIQSLSTQLQLVELMFTWLLVNMVISEDLLVMVKPLILPGLQWHSRKIDQSLLGIVNIVNSTYGDAVNLSMI